MGRAEHQVVAGQRQVVDAQHSVRIGAQTLQCAAVAAIDQRPQAVAQQPAQVLAAFGLPALGDAQRGFGLGLADVVAVVGH